MAAVAAGRYSVETVRRATTKDIKFAKIDSAKYFYSVELDASAGVDIMGVQIEVCD